LRINAPTGVVSGKANTIEVQAVDAYGNVDPSVNGTVTLTASGAGSLERAGSTGPLTATLSNGVSTFTGMAYQASADGEVFTLAASAGSLSSPAPTAISGDVVATGLQILGSPSASMVQSGVATSLSGLRLVGVDASGRIDTQWLASGQSVQLSLTGAGGASLANSVTALSLAGGSALSDTDSSTTTITLGSSAIASDGSIDLGALQLTYTNPSGSSTVPLALKAERIGGPGAVITGTMASGLTSSSAPAGNSPPQLNLDLANAPAAFSENGSAIAIVGAGATLSDADNSLQSLQVAITNGQGGDLLALATTPSGLTASFDASSGSLLIKAAANAAPTLADFQSALQLVRYSNNSETPDTTPRQITVIANDGSGLANATATASLSVAVTAVDDPTTLTTLPASIAATEDTTAPLNLGSLLLGDLDSDDAPQTLTLSVRQGSAFSGSLSASNGPGVSVSGSNSAQLTLQGTIADLNTYLQTNGLVSFTPASQANGNHALSFDLATGGTSQNLGSTTINVSAVNDPAVFSGVPPVGTVGRLRHGVATTLQSLIGTTPISVADSDLADYGNTTQLSLQVLNASLAGLSAGAHSGGATLVINSTSSWLATGTLAQLNALLADPAITLQSTAPGMVPVRLILDDGSGVIGSQTGPMTGKGGFLFRAVSDPVLNNPASSSAHTISAGFGESLGFLSISDPDANGSNPQTFTLTIGDPAPGTSLFAIGDDDLKAPGLQLRGTAAQINSQLLAARYQASAVGSSSLPLELSNGLAPVISSAATFSAINSPPTLSKIGTLRGAKEDQALAISFSDLAAIADEADNGGSVEGFVVKALSSGTLKLGTTEQTAPSWAAGSNDRITPALNAYWTPDANANGTGANAVSAFTVTALDNSNAESTTPIAVRVDVAALNDAPTFSGVPTVSTAVNTGVSSALADFTVADIDSSALTLTLVSSNGSIANLTDADGTRSGIQLSSSASSINAALINATFTASTSGAASIIMELDDGGAELVTAIYGFNATKLNSAPSLVSPGSARLITTNLADTLSYITVSDGDAGQSLTLSLTASGGSFRNLADADLATAGVIELNGTVSVINAALAAGSFVASADGAASISASVTDGVIGTPVTATYTLTASNAAPTLTLVNALTGKEDQALTISFADLLASADEADSNGSVTAFEVTAVDATKGTLTIGGSAWNGSSNKLINTDNAAMWTPLANLNGIPVPAAFQVKAIDNGGLASSSSVAVAINVAAVNDAPSLSAGSYTFTGVSEDTSTTGVSVISLLASRASDREAASLGIAIEAASGLGSWQYSTNGGSSWTALGTVATSAALLLANTSLVRYVPAGIGSESGVNAPTLTFHAWDGSDGSTVGTKVDASSTGGSSAFSSTTNTASVTVSAVDDPLTLNLSRETTTSNNITAAAITYQELDLDGITGNDLLLLDSGLTLNDPDSAQTRSAVKLLINSGLVSAEDRLELQDSTTPSSAVVNGDTILTSTRSITVDSTTATVTGK
jgi:hypothetical protein